MKKNVSGQTIGAQMITAADGSAFTGSVTAIVTIDGGTQAGGGACVHEGNGYHSYAITQGETNGDHIAVTFTGTGAIPATLQTYTTFPQTVDNATGIATIISDVGVVDTVVDGLVAGQAAIISTGNSAWATADLTAVETSIDAAEVAIVAATNAIASISVVKNATLSDFEFLMVSTTSKQPLSGLTVTGERSIDGGAFATISGSISEVSDGIYQLDALAADTNGDLITWKFSAALADDTFVTFKTMQ